jgi:SAM-dependent methyltransferase
MANRGRRTRRGSRGSRESGGSAGPGEAFEAEVLPGLAPFAADELLATGHAEVAAPRTAPERADAVPFTWRGPRAPLEALRTVTSVQRRLRFDVPRPKALLGEAHAATIRDELQRVRRDAAAPFHGLRLEAAGRDTPVMRRLRAALADAAGLPDDPERGDLQVRLRPAPGGARAGGWEVLIRLTPRPLSARPWRVANLPGGLNACVAAAAWRWLGRAPEDRVLNAMCGSGTLLIERAASGPAARLVGIDLDPEALAAARANLEAAGVRAELHEADATSAPFPEAGFDVVAADPPWGDAVGEVGELERLYAAFLREAARLTVAGGRLLVVTHALSAFDAALASATTDWRSEGTLRVFHGGHRPALHRLRRRRGRGRTSP